MTTHHTMFKVVAVGMLASGALALPHVVHISQGCDATTTINDTDSGLEVRVNLDGSCELNSQVQLVQILADGQEQTVGTRTASGPAGHQSATVRFTPDTTTAYQVVIPGVAAALLSF